MNLKLKKHKTFVFKNDYNTKLLVLFEECEAARQAYLINLTKQEV